jgi:hypothetical protein
MRCKGDCQSARWRAGVPGRETRWVDEVNDCGLCGRTFLSSTLVANSFMEEWLCECCSRPASPMRVFAVALRSMLRR